MEAERLDPNQPPSHVSPPDDGIIYFQINRQWFKTDVGVYTGSYLRALVDNKNRLAEGREFDLWKQGLTSDDDHIVNADDRVPMSVSGLRFFSTPRFINGG